ncbi:cytochrome d ubiquinol oxidase subunit I [Catenuloplanes nepalensis]|uniref:Cytochrome d ubiquinol oxidase subunit I n=1 Tax=Catenuloplanes nepalensis TaxID=587533 RepID=A0ABT9MSY5_9ACTN|nr:cytochrome ubiquinol oxidase subunit I [Catenuloplanes nepalensis]MDP9794503.1 cytochrome d ubiquinol oxidase subunit I [Catenuloplanes nepalensis]
MDALDVARWQFGVTTVYHFLFVPMTIGMSLLVAIMQTIWYRTRDEKWLRLTKFFGKLFLINFAMGIVTGIVQEFQFGMNWSDYSRFVGDVFGSLLAIEALVAFFLESTFLGLWIFGWERLPKPIHLATIWAASIGTILSMYFILAANSWMQNPVGFHINPDTGRAELNSIGALLTNKVTLATFPHTFFGALMVAGGMVVAVALWHLYRGRDDQKPAFRTAVTFGGWVTILATAGTLISGDFQGKIMTEVQPMKMAAAEGLYETTSSAPFSLLTIGSLDGSREVFAITVPDLLSWLGKGDIHAEIEGIDNLQEQYTAQYGAGVNYAPIIPVTYWSFRMMIFFGLAAGALALLTLWMTRKGRTPASRLLLMAALTLPILPLIANSFGWIFTEMGRQPWLVFGEMLTRDGVSRSVSMAEVITSFTTFTLLYAALAVVEVKLLLKYAKGGLPEIHPEPDSDEKDDENRPLAFAY